MFEYKVSAFVPLTAIVVMFASIFVAVFILVEFNDATFMPIWLIRVIAGIYIFITTGAAYNIRDWHLRVYLKANSQGLWIPPQSTTSFKDWRKNEFLFVPWDSVICLEVRNVVGYGSKPHKALHITVISSQQEKEKYFPLSDRNPTTGEVSFIISEISFSPKKMHKQLTELKEKLIV